MIVPIIKWVGGKRWLAPNLVPQVHRHLRETGGRYVDPFLGGGAVALGVDRRGMILGDTCDALVNVFLSVRDDPRGVADALGAFVEFGTDEESFSRIRDIRPDDPVLGAAQFIYLNKLGFNGLYRVNQRGRFNVPYGDHPGATFPTRRQITAMSAALAESDVAARDFHDTVSMARPGDFLYADPPYLGKFAQYTGTGFTDDDHWALSEVLHDAADRGVLVVSTNIDCVKIREFYGWAKITRRVERHVVGASSRSRKNVTTLIISAGEFNASPGSP